jgi:hypothetical protein
MIPFFSLDVMIYLLFMIILGPDVLTWCKEALDGEGYNIEQQSPNSELRNPGQMAVLVARVDPR